MPNLQRILGFEHMSKLYSIVYSPKALEDLKDIYVYIADELQAPGTARNQID